MLFRAFYALPDTITGKDDQPVNALLGTANLVLREVEEHSPRAVVLCFGPDAAEYRVELYDGYHAERPEVPDLLAPQFADSRDFFEAFGWTVAWHDSLEADDLLGTYARLEAEAGGRVLVMTGDRDMFQCATDQVTVLYVRTGGARRRAGGPGRGAQALRRGAGAGARLHRAARRPLGRHPRRARDRREDGCRAAQAPRLARGGAGRSHARNEAERPHARCSTSATSCSRFKDIATLRDAGVKPPADRATDFAGAAAAARERGINRLARRLEGARPASRRAGPRLRARPRAPGTCVRRSTAPSRNVQTQVTRACTSIPSRPVRCIVQGTDDVLTRLDELVRLDRADSQLSVISLQNHMIRSRP